MILTRILGDTISQWLTGVAAWHVVNGAPWEGDDEFAPLAIAKSLPSWLYPHFKKGFIMVVTTQMK